MGKKTVILIFLLLPFLSQAEDSVEFCGEEIMPISPLEPVWPGELAGGLETKTLSATVSLKFIVNELGRTENIEVVRSSYYVYVRGARRTVAKTKFHKPHLKCIKYMDISYEEAHIEAQ